MRESIIVLQDPTGKYSEGEILAPQYADIFKRQAGAAYLPVNPEILVKHSTAGFYRRAYGAGVELQEVSPGRTCPMGLYLANIHNAKTVHWCARLIPDGKFEEKTGNLRLVTDSSVPLSYGAGLSPSSDNDVKLWLLGEPDETGGWIVSGKAPIAMPGDGPMSFMLWGAGRGFKIAWAAMSQA